MNRRPSSTLRKPRGFSLLEVVVAMCILAMVLMAIFDLNATAVRSHMYTKRVTVASLLARSKMTDLEQTIYQDGPQQDDKEDSGDFSEEGWPAMKWKARILVPQTQNMSPDQLMSALFAIPGGAEGGLGGLFGGGGDAGGLGALAGAAGGALPPGASAGDAGGMLGMLGPMGGMLQTQMTTVLARIAQGVREIHLTVTWKEGDLTESLDVVTHVVAFSQNSDRNGAMLNAQTPASSVNQGTQRLPGQTGGTGQGFGMPGMPGVGNTNPGGLR